MLCEFTPVDCMTLGLISVRPCGCGSWFGIHIVVGEDGSMSCPNSAFFSVVRCVSLKETTCCTSEVPRLVESRFPTLVSQEYQVG